MSGRWKFNYADVAHEAGVIDVPFASAYMAESEQFVVAPLVNANSGLIVTELGQWLGFSNVNQA